MNMKKYLCVLAAAMLLISLAGCVSNDGPEESTPPQTTQQQGQEIENTAETTENTTETEVPTTSETTTGATEATEPEATTGKNEGNEDVGGGSEATTPTKPEDTTGKDDTSGTTLSYQDYCAMSAEEQYAFFLSFQDPADFFAWQAKAKAEDEANNGNIIVDGDTNVDLGGLTGGNG